MVLFESYLDQQLLFCRGKQSCTSHPQHNFFFCSFVSIFHALISSIHSLYSQIFIIGLSNPFWRATMQEKMQFQSTNKTWDLVSLPSGKKAIGCRWKYTMKLKPDSSLDRLKAYLMAKGYSEMYGIDYQDTFSQVTKMIFV